MKAPSTRRAFLKASLSAAAGVSLGQVASGGEARPAGPPPMPRRLLGKTCLEVPILGLGADGLVTDSTDDEATARFLEEVLDAGVTFFDTSHVYGKDGQSEKNLGLVMGTPRRKEAFLATKTGSRTHDEALRQVETSLKRLRTDHLDLIQVHHVTARDDVRALGARDGVLAALRRLRDEKVVRFVGLTGHPNDPQVLEALEMYDWDTFMGFVNPARFSEPALREQLPLAAKKGAGIIAMKTFGGRPGSLVGKKPGQTDFRSLLRFAWSQPVAVAIPGVTSRKQFRENLEVARTFEPMSDEELASITERVNAGAKAWTR